ncbi:amidoligase family protein [Roseomonas sp. 18066]|uniref:amidoligase family protein n=1 Tax=Roseomonas sp. 18066 TaxID=2681412 RepID=UPI00135ACD9E|nr:amidoligase family protein [Roseomonas sp. 18066]
MPQALDWRIGVEVELLAPPGRSRRDLAQRLAEGCGGRLRRIFHPQAEHGPGPERRVFETLTLGFCVEDAAGNPVARCVDDLTLQADLERRAAPHPGWYRIAADDARLARLLARHCDAEAPIGDVLAPGLDLFGGRLEAKPGGIHRLADPAGASVALAAPLPGGRERPCELITPPLEKDHAAALTALLTPAAELGFLLPQEGAVHLHFDAAPFADAARLQALIRLVAERGAGLRALCGTNPQCRRLGPYDDDLLEAALDPGFARLPWPEAASRLLRAGAQKFCDVNIVNLLAGDAQKRTIEIRLLPPTLDVARILGWAGFFEEMLRGILSGRRHRSEEWA